MSYRRLARTASPLFLLLGFFGRLPYAVAPLGTLLLLRSATGSYAFAGLATGAQSIAIGVGGLAVGMLASRFEPRLLGAVAAVVNAIAIIALLESSHAGRSTMLCAAVLVGVTQPQVGPLVRVHWSNRLRGRNERLLTTALSYEGAADETSFVIGPVVVGALVAITSPFGQGTPLVGATMLLLCAALPFSFMYAPRQKITHTTPQSIAKLPRLPLMILCIGMMAAGAIYGAVQTGVAAYASQIGNVSETGLLYAELGVGSALAGAACAWLPHRITLATRYTVFSTTLFLGMIFLATGSILGFLPVAVFICGVTIGPYMVTLYTLTERVAPLNKIALAMTMLCAGGPIGTAIGQTLAGSLVDTEGSHGAFILPPVASAVGLICALTLTSANRRKGFLTSDLVQPFQSEGAEV